MDTREFWEITQTSVTCHSLSYIYWWARSRTQEKLCNQSSQQETAANAAQPCVASKLSISALYPTKKETLRTTEAQADQNSKSVKQVILPKTVRGESKFHGKITVFTKLGLQWPVIHQSPSLWNIWGNWGTAEKSWTMKLFR